MGYGLKELFTTAADIRSHAIESNFDLTDAEIMHIAVRHQANEHFCSAHVVNTLGHPTALEKIAMELGRDGGIPAALSSIDSIAFQLDHGGGIPAALSSISTALEGVGNMVAEVQEVQLKVLGTVSVKNEEPVKIAKGGKANG